jgi:hypothetical protein
MLYVWPAEVAPGELASLCYGVEDATAVRIDPPVEALKPFASRCLSVSPAATTRYTLTATGASGAEVSRSLTLTVGRHLEEAPPEVLPPPPARPSQKRP